MCVTGRSAATLRSSLHDVTDSSHTPNMRSRPMLSKPALFALVTASMARAPSWILPSLFNLGSLKDWAPILILFTPSSKNRASFSSVRLSGLASMVNSTDLPENLRKDGSIFFNDLRSRAVGVPPPIYIVRNSPARESIWPASVSQ